MDPIATTAKRRVERRVPLSRQRVLRAAFERTDKDGVEALSMRKLAQELGVEAMSLYRHVRNKGDIVDGMVDLVFAEIGLPATDVDWKTAIQCAIAVSLVAVGFLLYGLISKENK